MMKLTFIIRSLLTTFVVFLFGIFLTFAFNSFANTAYATGCSSTNPCWSTKSPMPSVRRSLGVAADTSGHVYAVGGYNATGLSGFLNTLEMYDTSTDTWTTKSPAPVNRNEMGFVYDSANGKFYFAGGYNQSFFNDVYEYDPVADAWTAKAPMTIGRFGFGFSVGQDHKIYAIGGMISDGTCINTVEAYDPATNTWSTKAPMPTPRCALKSVTAPNGKIYAFAGENNNVPLATVEEYDPATDTWTTKAPMSLARWNFGASLNTNGNIYVAGGEDTPGAAHYTDSVEEYNPLTNTWTTGSPLPVGQHEFGMVLASDNNVYAIGGETVDSPATNTNFQGVTSTVTPTPTPTPTPIQTFGWPQFGFDTNHSGFNPEGITVLPTTTNVANLGVKWQFNPSSGTFGFSSTPAITNGKAYVICANPNVHGSICALDAQTGALLWKYDAGESIFPSYISVANNIVYSMTQNISANNDYIIHIVALDAQTGGVIWIAQIPELGSAGGGQPLYSQPLIANGIAYFITGGGLYAFNAQNGTLLWSDFTDIVNDGVQSSSPTIVNGILYVGISSQTHSLVAVNAQTGAVIWSKDTEGQINTSPAVVNGIVYIGTTYPSPDSNSNDEWGNIDAFNAIDGSLLWSDQFQRAAHFSSPTVVNGTLYIGIATVHTDTGILSGAVYAYNASTGQQLWTYSTDKFVLSTPSIANGILYFTSQDSNLYAVNASNGDLLYKFNLGDTASTQPSIDDGTIYAATDNGAIYAFSLSTSPTPTPTPTPIPNHPPTANAGGSYSVNEGGNVVLQGSGSDPDNDALTYKWDLNNDGIYDVTGQTVLFSAVDGPSTQIVKLQVCDVHNACATDNATVTINNVAPTITAVNVPPNPFAVGTSIAVNATFTDPGTLDTHTAVWDFGDGNTQTGTISEVNGSGTVSGNHAYTAAGVYTISVTVTDKDNGSTSQQYQYVVVYDPSAGFITGNGQITSPVGADVALPNVTGKAKFGIQARYVGTNTTPTGNTKFNFKNGNIDFSSTSYDWLVVSGNKAYLHGTGTVNGIGSFNFLITVIDGSPDKFRMKIKDNATNAVIYDNQMNASDFTDPSEVIDSGQIQVH